MLGLNECLRAVGLQHHYARFTSLGINCAAHLSVLTMEDYSLLGIRTMEDRTRLFHLVQMVKTLDLDIPGSEYHDDYGAGGGDEGCTIVDGGYTYGGHGDPDEDIYDEFEEGGTVNKPNVATSARQSCVRRRLDFSCENTDDQKLLSHPIHTPHVTSCASPSRNNGSDKSKGPITPLQLEFDSGRAVICGCNNNEWTDALSNHHTEGNTKPDVIGGAATHNSFTRSSPKCISFPKRKPMPATLASSRLNNKVVGYKDRKRISKRETLYTEIYSNGAPGCMEKPTPVYESKRTAAGYNYGLPLSSPPALNKKQEGAQRITVCVRKRPLTHSESRRGEADVVTTSGGECVIVHESKEAVDLTQYILQHRFYFDQVFGEESSNEEVYQRTAYPLVQHMLNGGKATCFAYGQTGAGKTHTMLGSSTRRPGLYVLAVQDIFAHLSSTHMQSPMLVYVSFFEIYCGQLYDLLNHRERLFAREDGQKVVHIAGLHDVRVDSVSSLLEVISQGTEERTQGMSGVNPLSSRSHALLQIQLRGPNQQIAGRLWFVDLAGSERASDTKEPDRQTRMEGAEINQSLLALKECIRSLDQEQSHTPFRQSKLTQVLRDSFVGDSMTCMIANISPGHSATEHTLNTLRYADRVKELRGQGGIRGGRRNKTIDSPKHNLSNSNNSRGSSVGTRRKSPTKKQKLGGRRETFGPSTPKTRLTTGNAIHCSTPKNSRWGVETSARDRKGTGLENITPVRSWLGIGDKLHRLEEAGERKDGRRENGRYGITNNHSVCDQNARAELLLVKPTDEEPHLWAMHKSLTERESGMYCREKGNKQSSEKGGRAEERRNGWIQQQRQVENNRDTCSEVQSVQERDVQKVNERDKERQRHLRWYHQRLQQFIPSSPSSSVNFSPSTNKIALSSSGSPSSHSSLQHSSHLSASAHMSQGLEDVLDSYRAGIEVMANDNREHLPFPSGEILLQNRTPSSSNNNTDEIAGGDSGSFGVTWGVSWEGTETRFEQDGGKNDRRRSVEALGETRVRRPAGMEGGERRRAWMTTKETEQTDRMTGAIPANVATQVSYSCHSDDRGQVSEEGLDAFSAPADRVWSTEEERGADRHGLVSTQSNDDSSSLFNHPPFESPNQRAPAERPLSPACEHINTQSKQSESNILPLLLQNPKFSSAQPTTLPLSTSITQIGSKIYAEPLSKLSENPACTQVHHHPDVKAEMSASPQDETHSDCLSYIIDPLSISLLQVDQEVATVSFLQGERNNSSFCPLENGKGGDNRREVKKEHCTCMEMAGKVVEDEDVEFRLSLLELPPAKTHCLSTSDTMTTNNHTQEGKDMCCATDEDCGISGTGHVMPEVIVVSLQDKDNSQKHQTMPVLGNKAPSSPLKPSTCSLTPTSVLQSISSPIWNSANTDRATQIPTEYAHNKLASFISTAQSDSVLDQCHTEHLNHSSDSNNSLQPNSPVQSNGQVSTSKQRQKITPLKVHPQSTQENFDHPQWRVVQAHWEQLEEMEVLCHKEETLLCQQPDMPFGEYVHKLEEIMEKKARCVHSMRAQLQPYLNQ